MANIPVNQLTSAIVKELEKYSKMVTEEVEEAKQVTAKELKQAIQQKSPVRDAAGGGDYKKGWRVKKDKANKSFIVHNKDRYQLTHLLEHGHAKRNGGRVNGQVHIRPQEEAAIRDYLERIEKAVKG